ncbi:MAG: hypothetical protein HY650_10690 [Acidobacteria bacterium]|nr:hypothetical protein [Acidobacteriota bacterium]
MTHLAAMSLFAFFIAVIFAIVTKQETEDQVKYGIKVFLAFMLIGLGLAWVMYPFS